MCPNVVFRVGQGAPRASRGPPACGGVSDPSERAPSGDPIMVTDTDSSVSARSSCSPAPRPSTSAPTCPAAPTASLASGLESVEDDPRELALRRRRGSSPPCTCAPSCTGTLAAGSAASASEGAEEEKAFARRPAPRGAVNSDVAVALAGSGGLPFSKESVRGTAALPERLLRSL